MTEPTPSNVVWLTQAKYDELKAELEELRGPTPRLRRQAGQRVPRRG